MRPIVRDRILNKYNHKCAKCESTDNLQIDHIIPLARGGRHDEDNFQVLCKTCNLKKGKGIDYSKYVRLGVSNEYIEINSEILETDFFRRGPDFVALCFKTWFRQSDNLCENK
jgi:5-methylcytosine-specific restriction endonuclease McrA